MIETFAGSPGSPGALARDATGAAPMARSRRVEPIPWPVSPRPPVPEPQRVVHFVGRITEPVFDFLRPATEALAQSGVEQCVVLLDDSGSRHLLAQFDARVQLVATPAGPGLLRRWAGAQQVYRQVLAERPVSAVHLHGVAAWLLGARMARQTRPGVRLFYSLHGSALLRGSHVSNAMLLWASQSQAARSDLSDRSESAGTGTRVEPAAAARALGGRDLAIIESPVHRVFLETLANPSRRPLIVTSSRVDMPRSALTFAQLAVLLGDESLGLSFNWIGPVAAESQAALKAANVAVYDAASDEDRAQRLASGWVYLAVGDAPGFPLGLVEAMATGLPCIAVDTPYTRAVIRHCETGLLCKNGTEIRQAIAHLIDAPELRSLFGAAARAHVLERFGEGRFRQTVLSAYALTAA